MAYHDGMTTFADSLKKEIARAYEVLDEEAGVNQLGRTRPAPARSTSMVANAEIAGALRGKPGRKVLFTAERLKTQRARLGFTQEQMAKLLGVSSLSIWKWESGGAVPRASRVPKILQLLSLGKREALVLLTAEAT